MFDQAMLEEYRLLKVPWGFQWEQPNCDLPQRLTSSAIHFNFCQKGGGDFRIKIGS